MKNITTCTSKVFQTVLVLLVFTITCFPGTYKWHPSTQFTLGVGFDPLNINSGVHDCLQKGNSENADVGPGATVSASYEVQQVLRARQLYQYLQVDSKINANALFFSGGGAVDYESQYAFDENSITWIMRAFADYGHEKLTDPQLKPDKQLLIDKGMHSKFAKQCGTEFVAAQRKAALVAVVFSVSDISSSRKERMNTSLKASAEFLGLGTDLSSETKELIQEAFKTTIVNCRFYARGGEGMITVSELVRNPDDLVRIRTKVADHLQKVRLESAVPVEFSSQSMSQFGLELGSLQPSIDEFVERAYFQYRESEQHIGRLREIVDNYKKLYSYLSVGEIEEYKKLRASHSAYLANLRKSVLACKPATLENCILPESPQTPLYPAVSITIAERVDIGGNLIRVRGYVRGGEFSELVLIDLYNNIFTLKVGDTIPYSNPPNLKDKKFTFSPIDAERRQRFEVYFDATPFKVGTASIVGSAIELVVRNAVGTELTRENLLKCFNSAEPCV